MDAHRARSRVHAVVWGHVLDDGPPAPVPQDLANSYQIAMTQLWPGDVIVGHQNATFPIEWQPWALFDDWFGWGAISALGLTVGPAGRALPLSMSAAGLFARDDAFSVDALQALSAVPSGITELLAADDRLAGAEHLSTAAIEPANGIGVEVWRTQQAADRLTKAHLSTSRLGDLVIGLNFDDGSYEVVSFRSDGQPTRSMSGAGQLAARVASDGAGFTVLLAQAPTDTDPSARLEHHEGDTLRGGVCGTRWFRQIVGDQSSTVLGNPSYECP